MKGIELNYPKDKLKIIVVNDGSTDNSKKLLDEICKKNDNVKIFLSFSGGGTRAAAFSYGVLETLRDAKIPKYNEDVSENARTFAFKHYAAESVVAEYIHHFERASIIEGQ